MRQSRRTQAFAAVLTLLSGVGSDAFATDVSGVETGNWTLDGSPYLLVGDVLVPPGETLSIDPGVVVIAMGHYKITVDHGRLLAVGTSQRPILMTADDTITGWRGVRLETANDDTLIAYCALEYARGNEPSSSEARGGALLIRDCSPTVSNNVFRFNSTYNVTNNGLGGAICAVSSSAVITGNLITENSADSGGGICTLDYGTAIISRNIIIDNTALRKAGGMYLAVRSSPLVEYNDVIGNHCGGVSNLGGGGISSWTGYPMYLTYATIRNNLIAYNTTSAQGGGLYCRYDRAIITNNVIAFNSAGQTGGGVYVLNFPDAVPLVDNTIIWGNTASSGGDQVHLEPFTDSGVSINYSNVQGGWPGEGNIDLEPFFVDPDGVDDIPGTVDDDFRLAVDSPCIDAGDPFFIPEPSETDLDGHARVLCGRVDMGPYEFGIGDYDCDRSVDLADFEHWINCITGPNGGPYPDDCRPFDFNADERIDLTDFAGFQTVFDGP